MKVLLYVAGALVIAALSGCRSIADYHVDAFNATGGFVNHAKVFFDGGQQFEWGVMDSGITAGMWPMPGPLGRRATVTWEDSKNTRWSQVVDVPENGSWDSIKFILNKDGVVTVETMRRYDSSDQRREVGSPMKPVNKQ